MATSRKTPVKRQPAQRASAKAPGKTVTKKAAKRPASRAAKLPPPPVPRKPAPAPQAEAKADKQDKDKKPKLVRDSFTIPKPEYAVLESLKERAAQLGRPTKKSELLRAGIMALAAMADAAFLAGVRAVPAVKTGRPAKS